MTGLENQKVTIYTTSEFMGSVIKSEGTIVDFGTQKYAQYDKAPFVKFIPKGKRKPVGTVKTYQPYIVILKGHGHPSPADMMVKLSSDNGVTVSQSRYLSFDDRYKTDFDQTLNELIKSNPDSLLMDVRHTQSTMVVNRPATA